VTITPAALLRRLVLAVALLALPACAHHVGKGAVAGFTDELAANQARTTGNPNEQVSRVAAERAVAGAVASLDDPAQKEKLRRMVNELVAEAISTALRTATEVPRGEANKQAAELGVSPVALLMAQAARTAASDALHEVIVGLGGKGQGPLGTSLAGTGRELSASVVGGAVDKLSASFPGCAGPDMFACIDRRIAEASHTAAVGFSTGLRESIGWPFLIIAAVIGLAIGLLGHWLWSLRSNGRGRALRPRTT
jgi:hypothetical protein